MPYTYNISMGLAPVMAPSAWPHDSYTALQPHSLI